MSHESITDASPDKIKANQSCAAEDETRLTRLAQAKIFGKSPLNAYMRLNQSLWGRLPKSVTALYPIRRYGDFLHALARMQGSRGQLLHTFFLRNRPTLELIQRLVKRRSGTDKLRAAVLGCSTGAEAYSVVWAIRSARPDLELTLQGVDISEQAVKIAERGLYSTVGTQFAGSNMFDSLSETEMQELFDRQGDAVSVKTWVKAGIKWHVGDVTKSGILSALGQQDIVVANNFLCHMSAAVAERCLRNIAHIVTQQGYLFVSGVDLSVRTKVAKELGWRPLQELLEEIHNGDPRMSSSWPFNYSSLEPLNKRRHDWGLRYATAFQLNSSAERRESLD
jgi:chemotaxis methyl-accepting protein methylase